MIIIKSQKEIESMRRGGKILASIMEEIGKEVAPGKNTLELDKLAEKLVFDNGGTPAFKGYGDKDNPFPATICASINNEIVHGVPSEDKIIKAGDIIKIDMGIKYEGMITDMARTFAVGEISSEAHKLMEATREGLNKGIAEIKAGAKLSEYYRKEKKEIILKEGMTIALEPMINIGSWEIKLGDDGWTYETTDGKLSAHFEDTVLVKKNGYEILTRK